MKLVWSPETASKAYIETVKSCKVFKQSSVAELVSAMAAGWMPKLIVETWSRGGAISTSMGLSIARNHTKGRHVCIVPDEDSKSEYVESMARSCHSAEITVGEPEEAMEGLQGIDFLVVDSRVKEFARILRVDKLGHRGAVLICKNASSRVASDFRWRCVLDRESRIVWSVFLPEGKGWIWPTWGQGTEGRPDGMEKAAGLNMLIGSLGRSLYSGNEWFHRWMPHLFVPLVFCIMYIDLRNGN